MKKKAGAKGFRLMILVLGALRKQPLTIREASEVVGVDYVSSMRIFSEFRAAGIIVRGERVSSGKSPYLYSFKGGEAVVDGRPLTRAFLRIWNALLIPESAQGIADDAEVNANHVRKTIHEMRAAGLAYRAEWKRNQRSEPTVLWALGNKRDATRPDPLPVKEYNRRANRKRSQQRLVKLVSSDPWSVLIRQVRMAA